MHHFFSQSPHSWPYKAYTVDDKSSKTHSLLFNEAHLLFHSDVKKRFILALSLIVCKIYPGSF